jgi:hypothetical protein
MTEPTSQPILRIVRGEPTAEELAVVTALVSAAAGVAEGPKPPVRGRWNDPVRSLRQPLYPGYGAWRAR